MGKTVLDPEQSCQYHYGGWMPYIVLNLDELIEHIKGEWPRSEILVCRNHMVLGGRIIGTCPRTAIYVRPARRKPPSGCSWLRIIPVRSALGTGWIRIPNTRSVSFCLRGFGGQSHCSDSLSPGAIKFHYMSGRRGIGN